MERRGKTGNNTLVLQLVVGLVTLAVITGMVLTVLAAGTVREVAQWFDPELRALFLEREHALQQTRITRALVGAWTAMMFQVVALLLFVGAAVVLVRWLWSVSRRHYAREGLYPILEHRGGFYDPNRDNAGVLPVLTWGALEVQRQAALRAEHVTVTVKKNESEVLDALRDSALPKMLPAQSVTDAPSLNALTIGQGASGQVLRESLYNLMHLLVVGTSGWGKSAFLRFMLWQLAQVREPLQVVGIDCFGSELNAITQWDKLLYPVARDVEAAAQTLAAVTEEIGRRKVLYQEQPTAYDLPSYNRLADEALSPVVVIVDEGTAMLADKTIGRPLAAVVQTARQYGVYVFLAGQSAKSSVIDTATRDNFSSKLCFKTSPSSMRAVLGETVEEVHERGRAWSLLPGREMELLQVPFVSREDLARLIQTGEVGQLPQGSATQEEQARIQDIIRLKQGGESDTGIARKVFGHGTTFYIDKVRDVLEAHTF